MVKILGNKDIEWQYDSEFCSIAFTKKPDYTGEKVFAWGFPYRGLDLLLNCKWDKELLNEISGYFFAVRIKDDQVEVVADILGGYRAYYYQAKSKVFISDSYELLLDALKREIAVEQDEVQLAFWNKHRYTLNRRTLIKGLNKFSPASICAIYKGQLKYDTYFKNYPRTTNSKKLLSENYEELKNNLSAVYQLFPDRQYVLFYSGGDDSTLLLFLCKELGIPVNCVVIKYLPDWSLNIVDVEKATANLKRLGVPYSLIEVDLTDASNDYGNIATSELLFDRHLAVHFYKTYKQIAEVYARGGDVVIINGQSADSILSFGPSEFTRGNMLKRAILAFSNGPIAFVGKIMSKILNVPYVMPCGIKDASMAIMDDDNYIFALDKKCQYTELLEEEYVLMQEYGINNYEAARMYSKIIGFLQGPDNQVVIRAALHNKINKVVMPFTSPKFIYNVVRYKDNLREIRHPKYFVRDILRIKYGYVGEHSSVSLQIERDFDMENFRNKVMEKYTAKLMDLLDK